MTFTLSETEEQAFHNFCKKHKHPEINKGAIGGHISVNFTITSIGSMPSVICDICGETENLTDYNNY